MNWPVLMASFLIVAAISAAEVEIPDNSLESHYCVIECDQRTGYLQPDGKVTFGSADYCTLSYESTIDADPDVTISLDIRFHERAEHTLRLTLGSETVIKTFTGNTCKVTFEEIALSASNELKLKITGGLEDDPLRVNIELTAIADGCTSRFG